MYSRTITTTPETADLLNYLVDTYVLPVMQRRIVQGSMTTTGRRKKLSPQEELEAILNFAGSTIRHAAMQE